MKSKHIIYLCTHLELHNFPSYHLLFVDVLLDNSVVKCQHYLSVN